MSKEERTNYFAVAQILSQTPSGLEEAIEYVDKAVEIDPILSENERALLSLVYKQIISPRRQGIKALLSKSNPVQDSESSELNAKLEELKTTLINELIHYAIQLIDLVDNVILPQNKDPENAAYYTKLKADYYRYICEAFPNEDNEERQKYIDLAKESYENALEISESSLLKYSPTNLGLILNYTVFLYDIVGNTEEAVKKAKETYETCYPLIDQNNEQGQYDARSILTVLDENIKLWDKFAQQQE